MVTQKNLITLCFATVFALGLAACSSSDDGSTADAPTGTTPTGTTPTTPPAASPVEVMMALTLGAAEQMALRAVLGKTGDSDMLQIAAGESETRAGVPFSCESAYPCTVTLTNNLGVILASVMTYKLPDADDPMVTAMIPLPMDPLHPRYTLNASNAASVQAIIDVAFEAEVTSGTPPTPEGARDNASTTIGGLDIAGFGVHDMSKTTLTSSFDPNVADHMPVDGETAAMGGSTLAVSDNPKTETIDESTVVTLHADKTALPGWAHSKVLFADWGDSQTPDRDGGYETAALLYSSHEGPTPQPLDDKLAAKLANRGAWFMFTAMQDFDMDGTANQNVIAVAASGDTVADQRKGMMVTVEAPQLSTLATTLQGMSRHKGTYFGAPVTLKCGGMDCTVARAETQDTAFTVTGGAWQILPDAGAMIMVPDQDYMVFGAWLTVPDDMSGEHRIGVFHDGMQNYGDVDEALTGKAKYEGGAAGVYRDRTASGMFTARAVLEANFGTDMLSGRIDNFANSAGVYLGTDTARSPNDPATGGENDWVVTLMSSAIGTGGVVADNTMVSGSADGVEWASGQWEATFYGPPLDAGAPTEPSGVAGQFRATSAMRGVVGAFGAQYQAPAAN